MKRKKARSHCICVAVSGFAAISLGAWPAFGVLTVSPCNPRYFMNDAGQAVYLTGSHTWSNFQDTGVEDVSPFGYTRYLDILARYPHNFIRLWAHEHAAWTPERVEKVVFAPLPYARSGPGEALDGKLRFNLDEFSERYFERLRARVQAAGERGIYVAVMLFQGWSVEKKGFEKRTVFQRIMRKAYATVGLDPTVWDFNNPWKGHPFHQANNMNEIHGDVNGDGEGHEIHTLLVPEVVARQEAYVRKVVDTVNDFDNVLYEIANESHNRSTEWQYHMITFIHDYEQTKPKQHPVLMTYQWPKGSNAPLFDSPAEAVSPGKSEMAYRTDPPAASGQKVIITDTDHLWGEGGTPEWVWKSFLRGHNPIFMDRLVQLTGSPLDDIPSAEEIRVAMGQTLTYSRRGNLHRMVPRADLCSNGYCLADPGNEYLVYLPEGGSVSVGLESGGAPYNLEWFDPDTGRTLEGERVRGGHQDLVAPFKGSAVVSLKTTRTTASVTPCGDRAQ